LQPFRRLLAQTSFRLVLLQTLLFAVTFAAAGATTLVLVRRAEHRAAHAEIEEYEDDVTERLTQQGVAGLVAYRNHRRDPARDFRLEDAQGHALAGGLAAPPTPVLTSRKFWSTYRAPGPSAPALEPVLGYTRPEPGGLRLTVGEYLWARERQDDATLLALVGLAGLAAAIGMTGGLWVSRGILRRVDAMVQSVDRYAGGERGARIARSRRGASELDELAGALNDMMERENRLVEGLRQVSSDIAHDLRRPLAHHNQEIARVLAGPAGTAGYRQALVSAAARVDEVLETFQALLHIAELEAGAPGLALQPVDLGRVAAKVVDAYTPRAEAEGRRLSFRPVGGPALITAEPRVLGQAVANLIENALTHTPSGTAVEVRVDGPARRLVVSDNGPGVPDAIRDRIFDRFFRQESSRSTPGNGLGLALATAAVRAFGGELTAADAKPGLELVADFSAGPPRPGEG
jgi:signal transduction histidine kinase